MDSGLETLIKDIDLSNRKYFFDICENQLIRTLLFK